MSSQTTTRQRVFVSPYEAGQHVGCSARSIYRWIAEGRLPAKRFGPRTVRIRLTDLEALGTTLPGGAA
jgi:excisionase family DNA binding protein